MTPKVLSYRILQHAWTLTKAVGKSTSVGESQFDILVTELVVVEKMTLNAL
jgi:hypothetical protein